jgi:hypothetical protein
LSPCENREISTRSIIIKNLALSHVCGILQHSLQIDFTLSGMNKFNFTRIFAFKVYKNEITVPAPVV